MHRHSDVNCGPWSWATRTLLGPEVSIAKNNQLCGSGQLLPLPSSMSVPCPWSITLLNLKHVHVTDRPVWGDMPTHHTSRRAGLGLTLVRPANPFPLPHSQSVFSWKLHGETDS